MDYNKCYVCLVRKLAILDQICRNTETQLQFAIRSEIKGLHRLLDERERMLEALAEVDASLAGNDDWKQNTELQPLLKAIQLKSEEIMDFGAKAINAAKRQQDGLADKLRTVRVLRGAHSQYTKQGLASNGVILNKKG